MLAPQTLITATLVTIAEPLDAPMDGPYLECAVCGDTFIDAWPAYIIGAFPGAYIHTNCV